jgi:hypothetical protein
LGSGIATTTSESTTRSAATAPVASSSSTTTITTTATKASSETTASAEATATAKATAATETTSETTAATETGLGACEAIFANFKIAALPVIAVELRDSIACVFDRLKCNDSRALRTTIRCNMDVCTKNGASNS